MTQVKLYTIKTDVIDYIIIKDLGQPAPILWCNGGIWGIVEKPKVRNMIQLIDDAGHIPQVCSPPEFKIFWDEVILIPKKLAEIITGE